MLTAERDRLDGSTPSPLDPDVARTRELLRNLPAAEPTRDRGTTGTPRAANRPASITASTSASEPPDANPQRSGGAAAHWCQSDD